MKRIFLPLAFLALLAVSCAPTAPQTAPAVNKAATDIPAAQTVAPPTLPAPIVSTPTAASEANTVASLPLLQQAQTASPERYQYAVDQGAQILPTTDGKSFYVLWLPEGSELSNPPPMIVTLHGHDSWAFDEFFLWHSYAAERGYGIIALQWWFGGGETNSDYYQPREIYNVFDTALREQKIKAGTVLFHGFSRGSANSYGVTALDRDSKNNYFALTISNSGKAESDFPINGEIAQGKFGAKPFANTHWVMVCGMKDPFPDLTGCPAMRETRDWVNQYGGTVDLLIEDPNGDHGAFHRNPDNVNAALDIFSQLLGR